MKKAFSICLLLISSLFLFGFTNEYGIKSLEIENHDIKFDPEITIYNIILNNEDKLNISYDLEDGATIEINGNDNLKPGDVIHINLTNNSVKRTYIINISNEDKFTYNEINNDVKEKKLEFKSVLSLILIIISIVEIFLIIHVIKKGYK